MPYTPRALGSPARCLMAVAGLLAIASSGRAQAFIERIEPPVAQCGKTTRVTFIGSQLGQAMDLWSSLSAGKLKATPVGASEAGRATFDVQVAADTTVGLCGLRVATRDGLSNTHLFLIDDLPPVARPSGAKEMKLALPAAAWGAFRAETVDRYLFEVAAGQRVSFEVVGSRFGKDVDPLVVLRDARGKWLAERDNDPGLCFDCRFEHVFADAGTYMVEVRDGRFHAPEHATYVLRVGRFPAARAALPAAVRPGPSVEIVLPEAGGAAMTLAVPADQPLAPFMASLRRKDDEGSTWVPLTAIAGEVTVARKPCQTPDQATPAKVPGSLCGVLDKPGARDYFRLELEKGQRIRVRGEARALASPADLELSVTDAKGAEMRRVSDPGQDQVSLDFTAPAAGAFYLSVRDLARDGGPSFVYRLEVRGPQPTFTVDADVEGLTVPQGNYQTLPLTVTRSEPFGAIKLRLVGAPAGLTLSPDEIPAGTSAVIAKLSAAADTPAKLYTLQIVAEPAAAESGVAPVFVRTLPLVDRRRVNVDQIPYALREDQRRLPASLTDRLAVQVTPPSVFAMDLTEPVVTLGRYQNADIPIATTRAAGFDGAITFTARGGQLADKDDVRTRVAAEFPAATMQQANVTGRIHSRILSNIGRTRIEVEGTAVYQGRRITLTRSFELDLRPAFRVTAEVDKLMTNPGGTVKIRLLADRVKAFDGPITVQISPIQGLDLPATVELPSGKDSIELEVKVPADLTPRRVGIRARSVATVGVYEEELQTQLAEIDVRKPEAPKK
ncbi:MAG: PPC domain-containing protein [Gemmataceae bacterium]|nr:PPC domain-containing protein [Gemmataceae bacterium]